jgi:hypothetical protein
MRGTHPFCADLRPSHPAASSAPHAAPARLDADRKPPHSLCRQKLSTSTKSLPDASAWEAWAYEGLKVRVDDASLLASYSLALGVLLARAIPTVVLGYQRSLRVYADGAIERFR